MEDFPGSKPASSATQTPAPSSVPAATTTVKVSLDEWATVRSNAGAELMTDGLSGCVAVAVRTDDRIALTHVFSDAYDRKQTATGTEDRFDAYKGDLSRFIESVGGRDAIREVHLVHNGNPIAMGRERNLAGLIEDHFVQGNAVHADRIRTHVDSGCTITADDLFLKRTDNQALYVGGYTNTTLTGLRTDLAESVRPHLDHGTFACSRAHPEPAEVGTVRTEGAEHASRARYVPPAPEPAPTAVQAEAPRGVRDAMFDQIAPTLRGNGFGMNSSHLARDLARQADENGLTGVTGVGVNREGATPRITLEGNERTLEFDANGRTAALRPAPVVMPASSSGSPPSLYQQAFDALGPHRETLGIRSEPQAIETARELASRANQSGLTAISRLEVTTPDGGKPALIAHQDGPVDKQSQPMPVEPLQQRSDTIPTPQPHGPDKSHGPIML